MGLFKRLASNHPADSHQPPITNQATNTTAAPSPFSDFLSERQKRLLWRLYFEPEYLTPQQREELAKLDGIGAAVRDILSHGREAVLSESDPLLVAIIDDIVIKCSPGQAYIDARRKMRERREKSNGELVTEMFGETAVMVAPEPEPDAGTGEWPIVPMRQNKEAEAKGTIPSFTPTANGLEKKAVPRFSRAWEIDRREYHFRVKREVQKAHAEMAFQEMFGRDFDDLKAVRRWINTQNQRKKRATKTGDNYDLVYMVYPWVADNGFRFTIINNIEGNPIPADRQLAFTLFYDLVNTPEDTRLNMHSKGYGRQFQGMKGDGRLNYVSNAVKSQQKEGAKRSEPAVHFSTDKQLSDIQDILNSYGEIVPIDQIRDYFKHLQSKISDLRPRKKLGEDRRFWTVVDQLIEACTRLRDTENLQKDVSPSRVQDSDLEAIETPERELKTLFGEVVP